MKEIYEGYTTNDLYLNKPCYINGIGFIYPLLAKEYIGFNEKYWTYLGYSEKVIETLKMPDNINYFYKLLQLNVIIRKDENFEKNDISNKEIHSIQQDEMDIKIIDIILNDICNMLSLVTHKKLNYNIIDDTFYFKDKDNSIIIPDTRYDEVRKVIVMQNIVSELRYYEDYEYGKLMREVREKTNKENGILPVDFVEMVAQVKTYNKLTINEVLNENVFQIYCDYASLLNMEEYRDLMTFKLLDWDNKMKVKPILSPFIDNFYKEKDDSDLLEEVNLNGTDF